MCLVVGLRLLVSFARQLLRCCGGGMDRRARVQGAHPHRAPHHQPHLPRPRRARLQGVVLLRARGRAAARASVRGAGGRRPERRRQPVGRAPGTAVQGRDPQPVPQGDHQRQVRLLPARRHTPRVQSAAAMMQGEHGQCGVHCNSTGPAEC